MTSKVIPASVIGVTAKKTLEYAMQAYVMGVTSRGVFIGLPNNRVIFLSKERSRGPLTINLGGYGEDLNEVSFGEGVEIRECQIGIRYPEILVDTRYASVWEAISPGGIPKEPSIRKRMIRDVTRILLESHSATTFQDSLPVISGFDLNSPVGDKLAIRPLMNLKAACCEGRVEDAIGISSKLLGFGNGLTPAGDDVIIGCLLGMKRWGKPLKLDLDVDAYAKGIVSLANQKTSSLSANLIECASRGQGDERLIRALDGIVTGEPDVQVTAALLTTYGSSSGVDTFLGMILVLDACG